MDNPSEIIAGLAILSILLLVFFCAVKPHVGIASIFYFTTGILIIPFVVLGYRNGDIDTTQLVVALIMDGAFFLGGVISGRIYLTAKKEGRLNEVNKKWQKTSVRQGVRRLPKNLR